MGDSLQVYRSRIGTFCHKQVTRNVKKSYKPSYNNDYKYPLLSIFLYLLLHLVLIETNLNKPVLTSLRSKVVYSSTIIHPSQLQLAVHSGTSHLPGSFFCKFKPTRIYSTRTLKTIINAQLCILSTKQHLYKLTPKITSKGP